MITMFSVIILCVYGFFFTMEIIHNPYDAGKTIKYLGSIVLIACVMTLLVKLYTGA